MFNYENRLSDIKKSEPTKPIHIGFIIGGGVLAFLVLWFLVGSWTIVSPGHRGVLVRMGAVKSNVLSEGIHFKWPFIDSVKKINVQIQKVEVIASSYSKDLQTVQAKIALNFRINPSEVELLYQNIGADYQSRVIDPSIQEAVKASTAKFTASELISNRPLVRDEIKNLLTDRLHPSHIEVIDFAIVNFDFSEEYEKAIEAKQIAQQNALKAENDLKRIEVEAEQRVAQAKAEAEAIKIQTEALQQNQNLVRLEAVKKWNGVLPSYMMGDSVPFLNLK